MTRTLRVLDQHPAKRDVALDKNLAEPVYSSHEWQKVVRAGLYAADEANGI
jgi:hypothetical protein